jgi:flagellar protein FliJ
MARFVFRLQKVLDHRVRIEDLKKQEFIKARDAFLKEKGILEDLYKRLEECNAKTIEKSTGIFIYVARYNYITLLQERIEDQMKKVKLFEEEMLKKKYEFEESQKARKVIEKLKENAYDEFTKESDLVEQKQNDEFALYGHMRK